ncbi:glutathione peroxidase [Xanthomarina sp. F2636L]|uniref:glutathione peroxidase n=1 Tax=Xanthomarina sp. F2636L TaxID=2996018 RepID=UPI00225E0875|nr:glutathione peroxidase [Xanthomarina sp. F2636L]MCX7549582.1 glutathione peroxidase [Xanthomarina sp. F2636L]
MQTTESLYNISINSLTGEPIDLSSFKGKKILFVNTASECGFTGQYEGLQKLYNTYQNKLVVIGVPCNQFGGQEPGSATEIQSFCKQNYGVTFLMTEKVDVKGSNQHPLYAWLTKKELNGKKNSSVKWNFQKYLIDEEGNYIDYFYSITKPNSSKITKLL